MAYSHIYVWRSCTEPPNFNATVTVTVLDPTAIVSSHQYYFCRITAYNIVVTVTCVYRELYVYLLS